MLKRILFIGLIALCMVFSVINGVKSQRNLNRAQELLDSRPLPPDVFISKGTVLYHEEYKGMEVPIIADGKGGSYRWIADVPWDKFSIEEKFDMARVNGGYLGIEDLAKIWFKFGEWKKTGTFYGIKIYKLEDDSPE